MNKSHYIYITTDIRNGMKYIGQHVTKKQTYEEMMNDSYYGSGVVISNIIKKHGRSVLSKEIIAIVSTQKEADQIEIDYIKNYKVLDKPDEWYNRSPGGQKNRSEKHSEYMSKIMKEVHKRESYRNKMIECGIWKSEEQKESEKIYGKRIHLINTLYRVKKIKLKQHKKNIANSNGFETYSAYMSSIRAKELNKKQRSDEARQRMSKIKSGKPHKGCGKYTNHMLDHLMKSKGITNKQAGFILNCHPDTIRFMRNGEQKIKGRVIKRFVKDSYYEEIRNAL